MGVQKGTFDQNFQRNESIITRKTVTSFNANMEVVVLIVNLCIS